MIKNNHNNQKKKFCFLVFYICFRYFLVLFVYSRECQQMQVKFISLLKGEVTVKFDRFNLAF